MKILHITAFANRGGCEKNCFHFIKGSPEFQHSLLVLGAKGPMSVDWSQLAIDKIEYLGIVNDFILLFFNKLKRQLRGCHYDLVICWSTIRLPLQLSALRTVTNSIRIHLGNPLGYWVTKDHILNYFFKPSGEIKLLSCSAYVAESHNVGYYHRFPIKISLNPIELPAEKPQPAVSSMIKIGMVARLDRIKDHLTVMKAFALIKKKIPNSELHLVGDGILRSKLEYGALELGISASVVFHGDVQNVYELLHQWQIFVYATTMQEGLGSAVAEAMANGLACVLSDLPMLRELAPVDGLVEWFPSGDSKALAIKVMDLLSDPGKCQKFRDAAYQYASQNFGVRRFISDYL